MTDLDRIARAIYAADSPDDFPNWDVEGPDERDRYRVMARAALSANATEGVERLRTDCDRLREFNTKLCTDIELLRGIIREAMSALLIAQEDDQLSSAAYRGQWFGELIETCQRGLSVPRCETP